MKVQADQDMCITARQCSATAPEVFGHDDDGLVIVLDASPRAELAEQVAHAARICPSAAITVSTQTGASA